METIPETRSHRSPARGTAFDGGAVVWSGNLSPEERRVHQILAEVREGLDAGRLAEAAGLPKIALYPVLEGLRTRGLVEAYPGSPVLFYAVEAVAGEARPATLRRAMRPPPPVHMPASLPRIPEPPIPLHPGPETAPNARVSTDFLYVAWEPRPERSLAAYRARVRRGSPGLLIGRAPPPSEPGARLSLGEAGPPPRAERLDEVVRAVRLAGPGAAVLLDGLEYLVSRHGFDPVLRMVYHLRELAALQGSTVLIPVDPRALEPRQKALLEREAKLL